MVLVVFEQNRDGTTLSVGAPAGSTLLDVCDEVEAPVPFSCRDASCGTCLVGVPAGAELLAEPDAAERSVLLRLGAAAGTRLACRARLRAEPVAGTLRVRAVASPL